MGFEFFAWDVWCLVFNVQFGSLQLQKQKQTCNVACCMLQAKFHFDSRCFSQNASFLFIALERWYAASVMRHKPIMIIVIVDLDCAICLHYALYLYLYNV
jgi:hypothetical protein